MSAAKHTPGSWAVEQHDGLDCTIYAGDRELAELRSGHDGARCLADARLIAAAPAMAECIAALEAKCAVFAASLSKAEALQVELVAALENLVGEVFSADHTTQAAVRRARALIAKAKGGA